jgi:hypothetical protein
LRSFADLCMKDCTMSVEIETAMKAFAASRTVSGQSRPPSLGGVYAFYLRNHSALSPFVCKADGMVYIGSTSNLASREYENHFATTSTGFSTLRRSIGAILKQKLCLKAVPRSQGASKTNVQNYRFTDAGDRLLTEWMIENLEVGFCAHDDFVNLEKALLKHLSPLLNLKGCDNLYSKEIRALRAICADEARSAGKE